MTLASIIVGCDISKSKIDFYNSDSGNYAAVANNKEAIDKFLKTFSKDQPRFAFETTGYYGEQLRAAIVRHGFAGIQINPLHGRRFAQSTGRLAKTDRIDAAQLAAMAQKLDLPDTYVWNEDQEHLKTLITRRDQLVDYRSDENRRLKQTDTPVIIKSIERHIEALDAEISDFDKLIEKTIAERDVLHARYKLLRSIPGIGPVVAPVLLAYLPEAGSLSRSSIAALAGVAPMANESGNFVGKRSIAGGRPRVRRALYNAALATTRSKSRLGEKYHQFIEAGKLSKVALIAIARKIITIVNAVLRTKTMYA